MTHPEPIVILTITVTPKSERAPAAIRRLTQLARTALEDSHLRMYSDDITASVETPATNTPPGPAN